MADSNWLMFTCLFTSTKFLIGDGTDLVALLIISVSFCKKMTVLVLLSL